MVGAVHLPTVLADVPPDAQILHREPFVPVAPILEFEDFDEVLTRANALDFGLAAYVFTHDLRTAERAADALEAGMVGINDLGLASAEAPFGGVKESGMGRESGALGIREFLDSAGAQRPRDRRRERAESRFLTLLTDRVVARLLREALDAETLERMIDEIAERKLDPYSAAESVLRRLEVR